MAWHKCRGTFEFWCQGKYVAEGLDKPVPRSDTGVVR